jgi:glycosyltransferase involved in cell wall biosynthesis
MVTIAGSTKLWAFNMAEEMEKHGLLDKLLTSYSYSKNTFARKFIRRIDKEKIPLSKIETNLLLAFPIGMIREKAYLWNRLFDRWVAWSLRKSNSKVFIGWSGMSLHSIRAAKKKGMLTILERGSSHIVVQDRILKEEYGKFNIKFSIDSKLIEQEMKEYAEADYIAVPSYFVRDSFIAQGVEEKKIFLNPYGANEFFKPDISSRKQADKFRIVYLGTLSIRKGLIYLFEALKQLKIPQDAFEVLIIGKVEDELTETLSSYKKDNWLVIGHVDHYKLPEILGTCDIAVQPSLEEGLSMVIPQMMACGVPVVITPNTGGQNIIEDGINGFVVPVRDPVAIAGKLEWAFNNPALLKEIKSKASASINREFTWGSYGDRYAAFIKSKLS